MIVVLTIEHFLNFRYVSDIMCKLLFSINAPISEDISMFFGCQMNAENLQISNCSCVPTLVLTSSSLIKANFKAASVTNCKLKSSSFCVLLNVSVSKDLKSVGGGNRHFTASICLK